MGYVAVAVNEAVNDHVNVPGILCVSNRSVV
jgi:hypothetical protein